eukprot:5594141-Prymnesium_polylepis.1
MRRVAVAGATRALRCRDWHEARVDERTPHMRHRLCVCVCYGSTGTAGVCYGRRDEARGRGTRRGRATTDMAGPRAVEYTHIGRPVPAHTA